MKTLSKENFGSGIVIHKASGQYRVLSGDQSVVCLLSSSLRKSSNVRSPVQDGPRSTVIESTIDLVVGDEVRWIPGQSGMGMIVEVLPRRSQLSRRSAVAMPGKHAAEQVLVANVDQAVPVFAAMNPTPHWNMLDRYLVTAEAYGLPAVFCITKQDLINGSRGDLERELDVYRQIGYPVRLVSSVSGEGLEEFKQTLRGRISVLLGKTSLLNAIQPGLGLRVNTVNQVTGKGRHTTTAHEMFPLDGGGAIIDTPGEREFGLWDVHPDEIAGFFPEMRPHLGRCRFGLDCRHNEEPGCRIRRAVMDGQISPRRYQSYLRLREDG
jgi:ribosome biogenesis GTPase